MKVRESELRASLIHTALGYWRSQVLFTTHGLGVFEALAAGPRAGDELARECGSSSDYTERLLNAGVAIGLLRKSEGRFENAPIADLFLRRDRPGYMGNWLDLMSAWYTPWGRLAQAMQTGEPVEDPIEHLGERGDYTRHFIMAMHDYAMGPGREILNHLDLSDRRRLLDLGGGPGSYSILLCERHEQLKAVVFDLPPVVAIAEEIIASHGLAERVSVQGGDYLADSIGEGYDVVLLSNMLHQESPEACKQLLRKAHDAMAPEGLLVIQAMFLNKEKDGPTWPTLQSLLLLLVYNGGRAYSLDETLAMLPEAGFGAPEVRRMSFASAESIILARKA